jgi:hypothetical protein
MGLQGFPERPEGVAIARGGGVLGNFQNGRDFGEGELVKDNKNDNLPLFVRQAFHGSGQKLLAFVAVEKTGSKCSSPSRATAASHGEARR